MVRDPVDRAYSNWMHLWCDGLEPVADFETAFDRQDDRVRAGWAPFWRYRELGMYGEQLAHLHQFVDPERILVLRYRDIVDDPPAAVDRACRFLGISTGRVATIPRDNARSYVAPGWRPTGVGPGDPGRRPPRPVRPAGGLAPGQRAAGGPAADRRARPRPRLSPEQRERLVPAFADDVDLLSELTGQDFSDWLSTEPKGSFDERRKLA